jgi:hypothetical protein
MHLTIELSLILFMLDYTHLRMYLMKEIDNMGTSITSLVLFVVLVAGNKEHATNTVTGNDFREVTILLCFKIKICRRFQLVRYFI